MNRSLTIAGGGLAGLTLGIALRERGAPVRVIEAASYPRHRVCGEFISGLADEDLARLGLSELFASAPRHTCTAWFDGSRASVRCGLPVPAYGLSRHALDAALAQRFVELGGELRCGERWTEEGEGVVWASGRVRRPSAWIGLKAHYEELPLAADLELHLADGGYAGLTRIENDRVNVCGLFRRKRVRDGDQALVSAIQAMGLTELADRLRAACFVEGSLKGVSHFAMGWQHSPAGRVSVGDCAAMIPPFTGHGMAIAFQSALAAAGPLGEWSVGAVEWDETARVVRRRQRQQFSRRLRWARFFQSMLRNRVARRLAFIAVESGFVRFETLYAKVR